ncbi:thiol-disulfide oxidoreductase DCC family protein [Aneurinibacillus sp. REN35]|uniref:thiol-disulfide oxidoreductase DCC family protein n=1 Tax=Aneurinibacillus sp. REN35 TaxID=3237286 RepID=UPI003527D2F0
MQEHIHENPILLFDGVCNLCNHAVLFIIKHDPKETIRFASLQSDIGQALVKQHGLLSHGLKSIVLIEANKAYTKSSAALKVARRLQRPWPLLYVFIAVPRPVRDIVYNWIARNRYRWFGKKEQCMIPTPELRKRFLD